jgi:secreted trypsin-like serine protease
MRTLVLTLAAVHSVYCSTCVADGSQAVPSAVLDSDQRIVGGVTVNPPRKYQWLISLQTTNYGRHFCGGTLIAPQWVLTAAHCTQGSVTRIAVGMHSKTAVDACKIRKNVIQIINHPDYNSDTSQNDISLLKLESPVEEYMPIDALDGFGGADPQFEEAGQIVTVAGWGTLSSGGSSSDVAMEVDVPVVSNDVCDAQYTTVSVTPDMICAGLLGEGGKDACQGDSGGPLFAIDPNGRYVLTGIVSWGYSCADPRFSGVYTRVSYFSSFICSHVGGCGVPRPPPLSPVPPSLPPLPPFPPLPPALPPSSPLACSNDCVGQPAWGSDGHCDDGGPNSEYTACEYGSDCQDCGGRPFLVTASPSPPPPTPLSPPDSCFASSVPAAHDAAQRFIGGAAVNLPRKYQWLVSLQTNSGYHFCGGTLIAPQWVLTAAHCTQHSVGQVVIGLHSKTTVDSCKQAREVLRAIKHPDYNPITMQNDVSLLKLDSPVLGYAPIGVLDGFDADPDFENDGHLLTTAGWGSLSSKGSTLDTPMQVGIPVVGNGDCTKAYDLNISDDMLCAGGVGEDLCQGDSGGPLFAVDNKGGYVLTGVASWSYGCALAEYPVVFARVSHFRNFICAHAFEDCSLPPSAPAPPRPPPSPLMKCSDECIGEAGWASDGYCDDGGRNSAYDVCDYGTDCFDCGPRPSLGSKSLPPSPPPTPALSPREERKVSF